MTARLVLLALHPVAWLIVASGVLAFGYGLWSHALHQSHVALDLIALIKASSILLLVALAAIGGAPRLVVYALFARALGDFLLAQNTEQSFLLGAGAFLIGHVLYIIAFSGLPFWSSGRALGIGWRAALRQPARLFAMAAMIVAACLAAQWLLARAEPAQLAPLSVYTLALTLMTISTFTLPVSRWAAMIGGVLFFISDGFVALNLFHPDPDPMRAYWLGFAGWMIYWAGQAGLCLGALQLRSQRPA